MTNQAPLWFAVLVPAVAMFSASGGGSGGGGGARGEVLDLGASHDVLDLGARLLGSPHDVPARLRCAAPHADFFLLTEDAWHSLDLDVTHYCLPVVLYLTHT